MTYTIKASEIVWDTYDENEGVELDPRELGLPTEVVIEADEEQYKELMEEWGAVADYLSDEYGFCVNSVRVD